MVNAVYYLIFIINVVESRHRAFNGRNLRIFVIS
jgi:hypothetical protein